MQNSNIQLSPEESRLVNNYEWLLAKNRIIEKVFELFGQIQQSLIDHEAILSFDFPENCLSKGGKISKGENYRGLPYVILDYPRLFNREYIFAIRTMFWWGHFFSLTFHLSGSLKEKYLEKISAAYSVFADQDYFVATGEDEWNHNLDNNGFVEVKMLSEQDFRRLIATHPFIKLSKRYPLGMWEKIAPEALATIEELLTVLQ